MPKPEWFVLRGEWRQSIWHCTTSTETRDSNSVVLIHQLKETKSAMCGLLEFVLVLDSTEESVTCVMCLLWSNKVIWPALEATSSTESHRNILIFWELLLICINVANVVLLFVCELTGKGFLSLFVISAPCDKGKVYLVCSGEMGVYPFVSSVGRISFSLGNGWKECWWRWFIQLPLLPRAWDDLG